MTRDNKIMMLIMNFAASIEGDVFDAVLAVVSFLHVTEIHRKIVTYYPVNCQKIFSHDITAKTY